MSFRYRLFCAGVSLKLSFAMSNLQFVMFRSPAILICAWQYRSADLLRMQQSRKSPHHTLLRVSLGPKMECLLHTQCMCILKLQVLTWL